MKIYSCFLQGIFLFTLSFCFNSVLGQDKIFPDSLCNSYQKPLILLKGEKLVNFCDTAYIINGLRYRLYEKAKSAVINLNYTTTGNLITEYERALNMRDSLNMEITLRFKQTDSICNLRVDQTIKSLKETNESLEISKTNLTEAQKSLEEANKIIKNQIRIKKIEKLMWGLGGFGIGLITGYVLGAF